MFNDFNNSPPLQLAERARLHDADGIAHLSGVLLVVSVEFLHLLDDFAKLRVRNTRYRLDDGRFVAFVGNNLTNARFAEVAGGLGRSRGGVTHGKLLVDFRSDTAFRKNGFDPGDFATDLAKLTRLLQLTGLLLQAEVEGLAVQLAAAGLKLFNAQFFDFLNLHMIQ
jgi:hypothetical protein